MIFSVWQPDGGYDYYESHKRHGIGDDLPDAELPPAINGIGVPSQDAGRAMPSGARRIGHGVVPKGVMSPMDRSQPIGLAGPNGLGIVSGGFFINLLVAGGLVWIGYELGKKA